MKPGLQEIRMAMKKTDMTPLKVGDHIEARNEEVTSEWKEFVVSRISGGKIYFVYPEGSAYGGMEAGDLPEHGHPTVEWRYAATTKREMKVAPVVYGCMCTKCNDWYPHAEKQDKFVCFGCKT